VADECVICLDSLELEGEVGLAVLWGLDVELKVVELEDIEMEDAELGDTGLGDVELEDAGDTESIPAILNTTPICDAPPSVSGTSPAERNGCIMP